MMKVVCAIIVVVVLGIVLFVLPLRQPTEDQLYGCTVAQQAPNGECQ